MYLLKFLRKLILTDFDPKHPASNCQGWSAIPGLLPASLLPVHPRTPDSIRPLGPQTPTVPGAGPSVGTVHGELAPG